MNYDTPDLRPGVETYFVLQHVVRLGLRSIRCQEIHEWDQARNLLHDAAYALVAMIEKLPEGAIR